MPPNLKTLTFTLLDGSGKFLFLVADGARNASISKNVFLTIVVTIEQQHDFHLRFVFPMCFHFLYLFPLGLDPCRDPVFGNFFIVQLKKMIFPNDIQLDNESEISIFSFGSSDFQGFLKGYYDILRGTQK